jgi:hypothetical protein
MELGNYQGAQTLVGEAAWLEQQAGVQVGLLSQARLSKAYLAWHQGEHQLARDLYQQELAVLRTRGPSTRYTVELLLDLARLNLQLADIPAAAEGLLEVFSGANQNMLPIHFFQALLASAMLASSLGEREAAATLLGAADTANRRTGRAEFGLDRLDRERTAAAGQAALGERAYDLAFIQGQGMMPEQAWQYAMGMLKSADLAPGAASSRTTSNR